MLTRFASRFAAPFAGLLLAHALSAIEPSFRDPPQEPIEARIEGHIFVPESVEPTEERLAGVKLPEGFRMEKFATGLEAPRMMAVAENGDVYVTRRSPHGDVLLLRDADGDGQAEEPVTVAEKPQMHGIALHEGRIYLATVNEIYVAEIEDDGTFGRLETVFDDLPDGGQHPNRTIAFGPDGSLYISVGSTCNACAETREESATMLRAVPAARTRQIYASGLRNTIGFDWEPETGDLYGMDHGIDWLGDDDGQEELNRIEQGEKYGWPYVYEDGRINPADEPEEDSWEAWAEDSVDPVLLYEAHAAPMDLVFYTGEQFPEEYRGDAFVSFHGSWNKSQPAGYHIARIRFEEGEPVGFERFTGDFLTEDRQGQFGRPCGLALTPDGSLLVSDDKHGVIYRIRYEGNPEAEATKAATSRASSE